MQAFKHFLPLVVVVFAISCGQNSTKKTETGTTGDSASTATTETISTVPVTVITVPEPVQTSFKTKYPDVRDVTWSRYEPVSSFDWDWSGWPMMDTSDYMARFKWDGSDYWAWYDKDNNWIGTVTTVTDHSSLPSAVHSLISSQYAGYTIVTVDKENDKNRTAYEIDLTKGDEKLTLLVDENGRILKKK